MQVPVSGPQGAARVLPAPIVSTARLRGYRTSRGRSEVGTYSKQQPELHSQQWLRNVKGAGSASGNMLYNIEPATIVEQRGPGGEERVHRWRPTITYPLSSLQSQRQQGHTGRNKDTHKVAVAVMSACGGPAHTNSIAGLLLWYGQWFARRVWSYFGAQQTCGPDYSVSRPLWRSDSAGHGVRFEGRCVTRGQRDS
jgi:hypothetical protein